MFWDTNVKKWRRNGCVVFSNSTEVVHCLCYHLTDFNIFWISAFHFSQFLPMKASMAELAQWEIVQNTFLWLLIIFSCFLVVAILCFVFLDFFASKRRFLPTTQLARELFSVGYISSTSRERYLGRSSIFFILWSHEMSVALRRHHFIFSLF